VVRTSRRSLRVLFVSVAITLLTSSCRTAIVRPSPQSSQPCCTEVWNASGHHICACDTGYGPQPKPCTCDEEGHNNTGSNPGIITLTTQHGGSLWPEPPPTHHSRGGQSSGSSEIRSSACLYGATLSSKG
jgi:hypothetical protein